MQEHSMGDTFRPIVVNSDWINLTGRQQQYNNTYQVDIIKHPLTLEGYGSCKSAEKKAHFHAYPVFMLDGDKILIKKS